MTISKCKVPTSETELTNQLGDLLEQCSDLILNLNYWDCECAKNYIHHRMIDSCWRCGQYQEDSPNAREEELQAQRNSDF